MKSIRARLILWYVFILAAVLTTFSVVLYLNLAWSFYGETDRLVQDKAHLVATLTDLGAGNVTSQIEKNFKPEANQLFIQVLDKDGNILGKSLNLDEPFPLSATTRQAVLAREDLVIETVRDSKGQEVRLATYPMWSETTVVGFGQVGVSFYQAGRSLHRLFVWLLIAVPVAVGASMIGGMFLTNKLLRPVATITQTAREISTRGLSKQRLRIDNAEDELGRLAQTFNEMLDRLENAFGAQQRFLADAAHELRSPLTALRGEIEVVLRRNRSEDEYREVLKSSLEEIERLSRVANNLLTLARADAGNPIIAPGYCDLSGLCRHVGAKLAARAQQKGVDLRTDCADEVQIQGDRSGLEQVIFNLAENAIKYTPRGESVRIGLQQTDKHAKLTISDTGVGIAEEELGHIFERFFRVDKARTREPGGSGLGLAIAQAIVDAHGGRIDVTSQVGKGSLFTVWLPRS